MNDIIVQNWRGYPIRFINCNGDWWAVLADICDALDLQVAAVSRRIPPYNIQKVLIASDVTLNHLRSRGQCINRQMTVVNEAGIYAALFASRKVEARQFTDWVCHMLIQFRQGIGLRPFEVMRMTEPQVQSQISDIVADIFYDEESGQLMQSTVGQFGDVCIEPYY